MKPGFDWYRYGKCFPFLPCTRVELKFFVLGQALMLYLYNCVLTQSVRNLPTFPHSVSFTDGTEGENRPEHLWAFSSVCFTPWPWAAAVSVLGRALPGCKKQERFVQL